MRQVLLLIVTMLFIQISYGQIPCESECCPNGPQHTFDKASGPLPFTGPIGGPSWIAIDGSPYYNAEDGCDSPSCIALPAPGFTGTSEASFSDSGIGGPQIQFQEGLTYCIQICTKNNSAISGNVELYADDTFIQSTSMINSSDGWVTDEFNWTSPGTFFTFSIVNNNANPVDGLPEMLVDDICYSPSESNLCEADFEYEDEECGEVCLENTSCGEYNFAVWTFFGPGLPPTGDPVTSNETCYTFPQSGTYTVDLTIFCVDGTSSNSTEQIVVELDDPPTFTCPADDQVILIGPECTYDYTVPSLMVSGGTAQCTYNGMSVNQGDIITLDPGLHQFSCIISSDCFEIEECVYSIEVICEDPEPQDTLCGQSVITCFSGNSPDNSIANGYVLGIVNNKEWGPHQTGLDWAAASGSNIYHHSTWIASRMGEVFGIAIDGNDQIYVSSTSLFGNTLFGSAGEAGIYQVDPVTGTVTDFITTGTGANQIPNDGAGLGNICYDEDHNQLFVTNFYDGNIYRIDITTGTILGSFDPFGATSVNGTPQFADLGQRPWGIAYNQADQRLYYSNWVDYSGTAGPNTGATTIYSIALDGTGDFQPSTESLEITLSQYWYSSPVSDIEFDIDGKMLIAQRSVQTDQMQFAGFNGARWAHRSFVLEYQRSGTSWSLTPGHSGGIIPKYGIGGGSLRNSSGGIDYGYESHAIDTQPQFCGQSIWASGDNLTSDSNIQRWLYGLQGLPNSGGTNVNSVIIDYDGIYAAGEKAMLGDVQIFDCECYVSEVDCDSLMVMSTQFIDPNNEEGCCHSFDLKNNWGQDIVEVEVDLLDANWIFNNVMLDPSFSFGSCGSLNQQFCLEHTSGSIPSGLTTNAFNACFASLITNPTTNPSIEIKWKQVINEIDTVIACRDTLFFECLPPPPNDTCLIVENQEINCDPIDPTIYNYCFDVTNLSGVDVGQITLECLDPGFFFNPPFNLNSHIAIPSPNPLPAGQSTQVCVGIYTNLTITTPRDVCMKLGLISADGTECCHEPVEVCVEIEPCCDPCELKDVITTNISMNEEECCYSLGLENLCEIPYFTKFEAEVLTNGVCFGSHVINPTQAANWNQTSTADKICLSPVGSGYIDQVSYPGLLDFCLDKIDDISKRNPEVVFRWYATDPLTGVEVVMCTDTLITDCMEPDENLCLEIFDQELICLPDSSKYRYTFTIVNHSNPAFTADRLHLTIKNDPTNFAVVPTGPIIPLNRSLASGDTTTITTCIGSAIFPATIPDLVFGYRLQNSVTGDCCFESVCDTIPIPPCPSDEDCCDDFDEFCDLVDLGFQVIVNTDCSINIDATQFDTCHWYGTPAPDWGDGSIGLQVITPAVGAGPWTHTYAQSGTYNICITVFEGTDEDNFCWDKQMCTEVEVECPSDEDCCDDFDEFCDLVDLGFQVITNDDCSITIDATQFDSCHWYGTPAPDWGDGSIGLQVITPAVGAGPWTHTYAQSGTYNICITVFEGIDEDNFCWDKVMCTEVIVECLPDEDCCDDFDEFCDLVDLGFQVITNDDCSITINATQFDTCHWFGTLGPDWGDGSIGLQVITPAVGAGSWTHTYTQSGTYNICITVYEGTDEDNFCWDKEMCTEVFVECGCEPDTSCFLVDNIVSKEVICDTDNCYAEPFCLPWLTALMSSSSSNGCQPIIDYSSFRRAIWNGQTVFIGSKNGAPDGGSQDIYDCDGNLLQSCTQDVTASCNPDAGIDISSDLQSINQFWSCGDSIPDQMSCKVTSCMNYDDPYCSDWVVAQIANTDLTGCPTTSTFSFFKARVNGQTVLIQEELGVPNIDRYTIYDCDGTIIQNCLIGVGTETCTIDSGIDINIDVTDRIQLWTCGDPTPTLTNCTSNFTCIEYCFDITNTTSPAKDLERIDLSGAGGISPSSIRLVPALLPNMTRSVTTTICGDYLPGDAIQLSMMASDTCCTESIPLLLEVPECPEVPDSCCDDFDKFCELVDFGFQVISNDDCSITIDATQFDSCHWYGTPAPDWGDGSVGFNVITPAVGAGPWSNIYDNPGTYNICITVYEGTDEDNFCWDKEMCTEVTIDCPCDPNDPCDDLSISVDPLDIDECCFVGSMENDHCEDLYKGIRIDIASPASIAQVQALNGWTLSQLSPVSGELLPPGGMIPLGDQDVFNICNQSDGAPVLITVSWLQTDPDGECIEICSETEELSCPANQQGCVEIVQDSIDCDNNLYCFKAVNVTDPEIILKSLEFIWVSPSTATLTPNPVSIPPLMMGDTTDWVCIEYDAAIDSTCFVLVGHEADLPAGEPVTWCCTDTTKYYITPEEYCPCDPIDIDCDALDVTMVPDPITGDTCCFIGSIDNQYCSDLFKGIKVSTIAPANISSIQGLNGWIINTISSTEAEIYPPTPHISLGSIDVFSGCNLDGGLNPFMVTVNWLVEDDNGDCVEYCDETFDLSCDGPEPDCVQIVADSLDCNNESYCFQLQNNSSPGFTIQSIDLVSISPSGTILIPNPISILPLAPGATSDWICVDYSGVTFGDTLCYKTVAHNTDLTIGDFPTWCCVSSEEHCFVLDEELCPGDDDCCYTEEEFCDLVDLGFIMSVDTNVLTVSTTQFDSCHWFTTSTPDFGDGTGVVADTISAAGTVSWSYQYAESGMYNICIDVIEMSADSTACWSKQMCKMLWYQVVDSDDSNPCDPSQIEVPNGFTPNGDGFNDVFEIGGNDACTPIDLTVFNRWGQVVYEQQEYDNTWDGTSNNGLPLANGTYYIILDFSNVDNQRTNNSHFTGYLDIRRD